MIHFALQFVRHRFTRSFPHRIESRVDVTVFDVDVSCRFRFDVAFDVLMFLSNVQILIGYVPSFGWISQDFRTQEDDDFGSLISLTLRSEDTSNSRQPSDDGEICL